MPRRIELTDEEKKRIRREEHACIRIFEDDTVLFTNKDGSDGLELHKPDPLPNPVNTYAQLLWYNNSPT